MGKKRIIKQSEEAALKDIDVTQSAQKQKNEQAITGKKFFKGRAYIQASYNNTIITITDLQGNVVSWASAGSTGFKGARKSTPFAASRVAEIVTEKIKKSGIRDIDVFVKGIGSGRDSSIRSLSSHGLNITAIEDITPLPHNGCRPKKARRV